MMGHCLKGRVAGIGLFLFISLCCFAIMEFSARKMGYRPGVHTLYQWLQTVDSLRPVSGFGVDSVGIQLVSEEARAAVWKMNRRDSFYVSDDQFAGIYMMAEQSIRLRRGETPGELYTAYSKAQATVPGDRSQWQQLVINFVDSSVNVDGFRSAAFRQIVNKKPSVLLLGDSFTFGHSASSLHRSFSDLLLSRGYTVYNSGITATDVAQYAAIAGKWIPLLRPDFVIVNFFMGNDVVYFNRKPSRHVPVFYPTNTGLLMANPNGVELKSQDESYEIYKHWVSISDSAGWFARTMSLTASTSAIYGVMWRNGLTYYESEFVRNYNNQVADAVLPYPYSRIQLLQIDSLAKEYGARTIVSIIPEMTKDGFRTASDVPEAFIGIDYVEMQLSPADYHPEDVHFNDHGHRRYADFLQKLIDEE